MVGNVAGGEAEMTEGGCFGPGATETIKRNAATPIIAPSAAKTNPRPARSTVDESIGRGGGGLLGIGCRMNGEGGAGMGPIDGRFPIGGGCDDGIPCAGVGGSSGSSLSASGAITTESDGVTTGVRAGGFR